MSPGRRELSSSAYVRRGGVALAAEQACRTKERSIMLDDAGRAYQTWITGALSAYRT